MNSAHEWNDYWSQKPQTEALFTDKKGQAVTDFAAFWQARLDPYPESTRILDVACGAGALFKSVAPLKFTHLAGLDCSSDALALFSQQFPTATTILNNTNALPADEIGQHDLIVSQFGIEYLGPHGLNSIPKLLHEGAEFIALCHYKDGHIYTRYKNEQQAIELLFEIGAFTHAKQVVENYRQKPADGVAEAKRYLATLANYRQRWNAGSLHFVQGIYQLLSDIASYEAQDLLNWVDGMEGQLRQTLARVSVICDVALSADDIAELIQRDSGQVEQWSARPFYMEGATLPVAWELGYKKTT